MLAGYSAKCGRGSIFLEAVAAGAQYDCARLEAQTNEKVYGNDECSYGLRGCKSMPRLCVELAASLIDVETDAVHCVAVDVVITNSSGGIVVDNLGGSPRSIHGFSTSRPDLFGIHVTHTPYIEQGALVFAAACTLANQRVMFGPVNPAYLGARIEHDPIPPVVETVEGRPGVTRTSIAMPLSASIAEVAEASVHLDETEVLNLGTWLAGLDIFTPSPDGPLPINNTREVVKSYFEAIRAQSLLMSYSSLYQCLEKAVNADGKNRVGEGFDSHVASIVNREYGDIKELRTFRNRNEHALRNQQNWDELHRGED